MASWFGKLKEAFNKPASPEAMRMKRLQQQARAKENARKNAEFKKLAQSSNGMLITNPAVQEDAAKQHRREMRQERVPGFSFTCK